MNILIIGRGGRESAIAKKVLESSLVSNVYVTPGNAQTKKLCKNLDINETDITKLLEFAKNNHIDLTIVGPESSLNEGIVDEFQRNNLKIFGPTKAATIIEASKSYAKRLMQKYDIPTAAYKEFDNSKDAFEYAQQIKYPHVIKYDGLAAGKGVVICQNLNEMNNQIKDMLEDNKYGKRSKVILEEFLDGEEFTLLALVNKDKVYPLEISRDYKRAYDDDLGLNTGGMGSICPFDKISQDKKQEAVNILEQTAKAMVKENNLFCGVLYGGFISTLEGVKVIEYNARFGDPETEVVLQKLSSDLVQEILNLLDEKKVNIINDNKYYVGITLAAKGYPKSYEKNFEINNLEDTGIYHMGTDIINNKTISIGGRVIFVSASGHSIKEARQKAYEKIKDFENENLFYRKDIGK